MKKSITSLACFIFLAALACSAYGADAAMPTSGSVQPNGTRVLNNFVTEVLNVRKPGKATHKVSIARDSWIYISVAAKANAAMKARIDQDTYPLKRVGKAFETMRYLRAGDHEIGIVGSARPSDLIVRCIGELSYCEYGGDPYIPETGRYSWDWLRKNVLDNYNTIIGSSDWQKQETEIKDWASEGKWWMTMEQILDWKTPDDVYKSFASSPGMTHPLMKGIWADEFGVSEPISIVCDGLRKLAADPKFKDRQFVAYLTWGFTNTLSQQQEKMNGQYKDSVLQVVMDNNYRLAQEWYANDWATEDRARTLEFNDKIEARNRANFEASYPGSADNRLLILGINSQPQWSANRYPNVNWNVFMDMQFQYLATNPAFAGARGLQGYYSPYAGEEQTRLFAKLIRHYAIEGHTDRMLKDPYELKHIENSDFTDGTAGWTLSSAQEGSMAAKSTESFGLLEGRSSNDLNLGDTFLWTKRSSDKPNVFSQEIRNLEPGRLYSLRFITGNYQDLVQGNTHKYVHSVHVDMDGANMLPDKAYDAPNMSSWAANFRSFSRDHRYWTNYHQRVFRAKGRTAKLTFTDWASVKEPGGPADEELMWNFIQVKPYFSE